MSIECRLRKLEDSPGPADDGDQPCPRPTVTAVLEAGEYLPVGGGRATCPACGGQHVYRIEVVEAAQVDQEPPAGTS